MQMKVLPIVCAVAFSFVSCVAAQASYYSGTSTYSATGSGAVTATAVASVPQSSSSSSSGGGGEVPQGPIIAGSTVAAVFVVAVLIFFGLRYRRARRMSKLTPVVAVVNGPDTSARCDDLERQLRVLREQVVQLEGQQLTYSGVLYSHEKDEGERGDKADRKSMVKEALPTYAD
ncbi:hypothetical protein DFH07DRAFT_844989 [Mycena maculata]|uniref:Membrane-associated protein n=1 Tax=Mycena maculata TaxID=230809 RepID=A0AAD7I3D3_9AGAR|nr:hypothetical protein DFH07DRAFT_844989 [Mycena maculata]